MKKYLTLFSCLIILVSCEKESISPNTPSLMKYSIETMDYPHDIFVDKDFYVKIKYNKNSSVSQRLGGLIFLSPMTGFSYATYDKIIDDVEYSDNKIIIIQKVISTPELESCAPLKRTLLLENDKLVKRIEDNFSQESYDNDTTYYSYNNNGNLEKTTNRDLVQNFFFDSLGNLTKITTRNTSNNRKDTILYSGYDNTPNLTKKLFLFKECFIRSLSENNYTMYSKKTYDENDNLVGSEEKAWSFEYDANNYLIY